MISNIPAGDLVRRQRTIEQSLYKMGITFTVYSDDAGTEKIMPFDVVPRIVAVKRSPCIEGARMAFARVKTYWAKMKATDIGAKSPPRARTITRRIIILRMS